MHFEHLYFIASTSQIWHRTVFFLGAIVEERCAGVEEVVGEGMLSSLTKLRRPSPTDWSRLSSC